MRQAYGQCGRWSSPCCASPCPPAPMCCSPGCRSPSRPLLAVGGVIFLLAFALADRERGYGRIAAAADPAGAGSPTPSSPPASTPVTGRPAARSPGRCARSASTCCAAAAASARRWPGSPRGAARGAARPARRPLAAGPRPLPLLLLAAHIAVGLLAAAWLRRGEAALAGLLRAASVTAFRPLRVGVRRRGAARDDRGPAAPRRRYAPAWRPARCRCSPTPYTVADRRRCSLAA